MLRHFFRALAPLSLFGCREPPSVPKVPPASPPVGDLVRQLSEQVHLRDADRLRHAADLADYGMFVTVLGALAVLFVLFLVVTLSRLAAETRRRRILNSVLNSSQSEMPPKEDPGEKEY